MKTNTSPNNYCTNNIYNCFFSDGICYFSTTAEIIDLYRLDDIAGESDKIVLINEIQEKELFEKGFVYDGYQKSEIDNLKQVYVRKYKLKTSNGKITATTDLSDIRDENCKYSRFISDLILEYFYIQHFSFKTISELLKLNYGLDIDYRRVSELYNKSINEFILKKYEEVEKDIRNGKIKLGCVGNYDEEFVYIKHQPYVRLTLIDNKTKIIIKDLIIPRKLFSRNYIKSFIKDATDGLNYHTIVTDGDKRYKKILDELGLNQQRCIFHSMQNLMSKINPIHNRLKRRIKKINNEIYEKESKLDTLKKKYEGCTGRPKKEDKKREKDIKKMKKLKQEISMFKAEKRKHKNYIKENNKYVKKISRILKSKSFEKAMAKFEEIWKIKDQLSNEIRSHLINLKEYLPEALLHTRFKDVPRTNNLIESFYKATLPRKIKYIFMTYDGLMNRIILANIRWIKNHISKKQNRGSLTK